MKTSDNPAKIRFVWDCFVKPAIFVRPSKTPKTMKQIRIVSPAKTIDKECVDFAVSFLESNGFKVSLGSYVLGKNNYFAGTDAERLSDFQAALDDESIDFILCARGGYGSVRIIDDLDFSKFVERPKLVIGFSDITVLHSHILQQTGIATMHAPMSWSFKQETKGMPHIINFYETLTGKDLSYSFTLSQTISSAICPKGRSVSSFSVKPPTISPAKFFSLPALFSVSIMRSIL